MTDRQNSSSQGIPFESASSSLAKFVARYPSFGGWTESWKGVPLEFKTCLADRLPPLALVGSVRAVVLKGDQVLMVPGTPPIFSVGGRGESGESIEQTLLREVSEECGWRVKPIGVIGFVRAHHLDDQRPDWGRPAPDFFDPIFAVEAMEYDASLLALGEKPSQFVPIAEVESYGIEIINRTFLNEALRRRDAM